jgi:hypothetical protein
MSEGTVFTLNRKVLEGVDDDAGSWLFEGGDVLQDGQKVGGYQSAQRVVTGALSPEFNQAPMTMTILLSGQSPAQNMTLQGVHDYGSGNEIGSVAAISSGLEGADGAFFSREGDTLTIQAIW